MSTSTIGIIILVAAFIMYSLPRIPISVTSLSAMLAMSIFGLVEPNVAISGFANTATIMVTAMMVIGGAFFTTGLADALGNFLYRMVGVSEKWFVVGVLTIGCLLAVFLNGALVFALLAPIIDSITSQSEGRLTRKQAYLPLGFASAIGNNITTISATSMIATSGLLAASGYHRQLSLFEPTIINLPAVLAVIIFYALFGYKLQKKWFDFKEVAPPLVKCGSREKDFPRWKMILTIITTIGVVIGLVQGFHYATVACTGAVILVMTGCISEMDAFRNISWPTVMVVGASIGFSSGLRESGAGEVIANFIIRMSGPLGQNPWIMCIVFIIIGSLMSNAMSDNASVAIIVPIALVVAGTQGWDPLPLVLASASGIKIAVATPISVVPVTMTQAAGYRFKDYIRIGGLVNLISIICVSIMLKLIYFM